MSDYGKNFGIYNYHKMITDTTANRKFCQCWDNVRNIIDETACLLAQQGIVLDKKKVTDIMAHKYNEKRAVYWYLNKRTEDKKTSYCQRAKQNGTDTILLSNRWYI